MPRRRLYWVLRGVPFVLAFALGFAAFRMGVGTDARDGTVHGEWLSHLYYTIGLFVLGGLDLGLPIGGTALARSMLWGAYFLAPAVTTSALVEGVLRLLRPEWLERRGLRGHIVVVGVGRLGLLFLEELRVHAPHTRLIVVDLDAHRANVRVAEERLGARFVQGDVRNAATLDALALERARAVILLTDDDLVNLEAAWRIAELTTARVIAHVTDLSLRRTVARIGESARISLFNAHAIAAERLYEEHLAPHFAETAPEDVVVLAGFGRFGQTILEYLQREAHGEIQRAVVVDAAAHRQVRLFRAQVPGFERCDLVTIQADLEEPTTWEEVERAIADTGVSPVYVVATDDDTLNLRSAVAIRALRPDSKILVRTVYESRFSARIADELRFTILPIDRLLRNALKDRLRAWL